MIGHVRDVLADLPRVVPGYDSKQGYELSGFIWLQGFNDLVDSGTYPNRHSPGGYDAYSDALAHFIRDVRRDLDAPRLPFVIGVLGRRHEGQSGDDRVPQGDGGSGGAA